MSDGRALLDDPWIAAQIEAVVAPYAGRLSKAELEFMREELAELLVVDEGAARLLRRARPIHVDESGEVRRDDVAAAAQPPRLAIPLRGRGKAS